MNDPISDMLTRIRNASRALLPTTDLPHSKMKESIAGILKREGYIADYRVRGGLGVAVVSTSEGLMTGTQARKKNIGGELLCYIW